MANTDKATSELQVSDRRDDMPTVLEKAVVMGDLSLLQPMERLQYYHAVCESVGLNPLTKPFQYIKTKEGALVLYATKGATDQVRTLRGISIVSAERDTSDALFATWIVTGTDRNGRTDMDIGSVSVGKLQGELRANAIMKALTKAKRRLTLSLAGLGNMLDESEVDAAGAQVANVDPLTGEVVEVEMSPAQRMLVERAEAHVAPPVAEEPAQAATNATPVDEGPQGPPTAPEEPPMPPPPASAVHLCGAKTADGTCGRQPGHKGKHQ